MIGLGLLNIAIALIVYSWIWLRPMTQFQKPKLDLRAFLMIHHQGVAVNDHHSSWLSVTFGVPQGSVLGPLFLLCIDDLSSVVSHSIVKLFADDVTICKEIACTADDNLLLHP